MARTVQLLQAENARLNVEMARLTPLIDPLLQHFDRRANQIVRFSQKIIFFTF